MRSLIQPIISIFALVAVVTGARAQAPAVNTQATAAVTSILSTTPLVQLRTDAASPGDPVEVAIDVQDPTAIANALNPHVALEREVTRLQSDLAGADLRLKQLELQRKSETKSERIKLITANLQEETARKTTIDLALIEAKDKLAAENKKTAPKVVSLIMDGVRVPYRPPVRFNFGEKKLLFDVTGFPPRLLVHGTRKITVSVDLADENRAVAAGGRMRLIVVDETERSRAGGWAVVFALVVLLLGMSTNLLRDVRLVPPHSETAFRWRNWAREFSLTAKDAPPFSLARVQMAFWTVLVLWGWLYILLASGQQITMPNAVLALLGISTGTLFGARIIDVSKAATARQLTLKIPQQKAEVNALNAKVAAVATHPPPQPAETFLLQSQLTLAADKLHTMEQQRSELMAGAGASQGFLQDILSDESGVSIHRLQMVLWTIVLGALFCYRSYRDLSLPEFDPTLLALMGISAGAYLGFKVPERGTVQG